MYITSLIFLIVQKIIFLTHTFFVSTIEITDDFFTI